MNLLTRATQKPSIKIHLQIADSEPRSVCVFVERTTKYGPQTRDQFTKPKRLRDVIVGACFQSLYHVFFRIAHRHHHDSNMRYHYAQAAASFETAHTGHVDIEQDQIEWTLSDQLESALCAARLLNRKPASSQRGL
jgi:hypothetical protein